MEREIGSMASQTEQLVCQQLSSILAGLPIGAVIPETDYQGFLNSLERFLPHIIDDPYDERLNVLDGIYSFVFRKIAEGTAEIFGLCIFIKDQTLAPMHVRLQLSPKGDEVSWLEYRLGEKRGNGMARHPYSSLNTLYKAYYGDRLRPDTIDWAYAVTVGERRSS